MKHYRFDVEAYLKNTKHIHDAEDLAYRRLLDIYYLTEKPLTLKIEELVEKVRLDRDIIENVLDEFFHFTEDGYYNGLCEKRIASRRNHREKNSKNGRLGGRGKKAVATKAN